MKLLAVALGASLLLNVVLLVRRPETPPASAPRPVRPTPAPVAEAPAPAVDVRELAELRHRVRQLEATKAEAVAAAPDRPAGFREKLSRVLKLWLDPKAMMGASPEAHLESTETIMEFQRAKLGRWKDPQAYVAMLGAFLEQAAVETKAPLGEAQRETLRRTLEEYRTALDGLADADAWQRFRRELGPEADALQRLRGILTPEQETRVAAFGGLSPWTSSTAPWAERGQAEAQIVQTWTAAYGLEDAQKSAVAAAARVYVDAAGALSEQMGAAAAPGRESLEWRRRSGQILLDALGTLEASLTPEQRTRLRQRRPAEVRVYDGAALQRRAP